MSFFEGGRKVQTVNTTTVNQQVGVQGSGNLAVSGGLNNAGGTIHIESLDPLALEGMERTAVAAIQASQRYVEFSSESNRLGLQKVGDVAETYANVARDVASTALTPDQISANRSTVSEKSIVGIVAALVLVGGGIYIYRKLL